MALSSFAAALAALAALAAAQVPSVPPVVHRAEVVWPDADWPGEMASLPLGNGDVSAQAWIERASGDLLLYLAKSDAFDISALPIKVGRLRLAFRPALWTPGNSSGWTQRLSPADGSVTIGQASGYAVRVLVDANAPALRVAASHSSAGFALTVTLEMYDAVANWRRNETRSYGELSGSRFNVSDGNPNGMGSFCRERFLEPDTLVPAQQLQSVPALKERVVWYHRNTAPSDGAPTYYEETMLTQGLDPAAFPDPMLHRTFGGAMGGAGFARAAADGDAALTTTAAARERRVLEVSLATVEACPSEAAWLAALARAVDTEAQRLGGSLEAKEAAHNATWEGLWSRSYVDISGDAEAGDLEAVNYAYVWQRYLDLCDGRDTWGVIKFNGQAFTVSENGTFGGRDLAKGGVCSADHRDWGPCKQQTIRLRSLSQSERVRAARARALMRICNRQLDPEHPAAVLQRHPRGRLGRAARHPPLLQPLHGRGPSAGAGHDGHRRCLLAGDFDAVGDLRRGRAWVRMQWLRPGCAAGAQPLPHRQGESARRRPQRRSRATSRWAQCTTRSREAPCPT